MATGVAKALALFDIDGTLLRRAGPHHRQALADAVRLVAGLDATTEGIPVQGMLDGDIISQMLARAGVRPPEIRRLTPGIMRRAQTIYARSCPDLRRKTCPGVRRTLARLRRHGVVTGLVTGNLQRIGWKKMEHAGLAEYFQFGAFAEMAGTRAELVRIATRRARSEGWTDRSTPVSLIGDHPNDVRAAKMNSIRSIAVSTGIATRDELVACVPDILLNDLRDLKLEMLL